MKMLLEKNSALSKEMPDVNVDIIYEIVCQLKNERDSLHKFLFVNKFLGEVAASFLWRNPFQFVKMGYKRKFYLIIQVYITCFNEKSRFELKKLLKDTIENLNGKDCPELKILLEDTTQTNVTPFFEYGKYLKEFSYRELETAITLWYQYLGLNKKTKYNRTNDKNNKQVKLQVERYLMQSIMESCQGLDYVDCDISRENNYLLESMQHKIEGLNDLTLYCSDKIIMENVKRNFSYFKNSCQSISNITFDRMKMNNSSNCVEELTNEFKLFVTSQNGLNNFIFDYKHDSSFDDIIIFILSSQDNFLTKLILSNIDFNNISFELIEGCVNLEILGLRSSKGLTLESICPFTTFRNLKKLDLSKNKWKSEVTTLIIKREGDNLKSLTIGEEEYINDDTLIMLKVSCPKINSLSISKISKKYFDTLFLFLKNFNLNTLQISQIEKKCTIIRSKDLLNYMKSQSYFLNTIGIGKNDNYWHYYDRSHDKFNDLANKHNIRIICYDPDNLKNRRFIS